MPIPSASSKNVWPCSNFFDCVQYALNTFKFFWPWSKVIFYFINLHIWAWSKIFDHIQIYWSGQKILNAANFVFELADGLGIIVIFLLGSILKVVFDAKKFGSNVNNSQYFSYEKQSFYEKIVY